MKNLKLTYRINSGTVQLVVSYGYKVVVGNKTSYKPLILATGQKDSTGKEFDIDSGRFNRSNPDFKNYNLALTKTETKINELFAKLEFEQVDYSAIPPDQLKGMLFPSIKIIPQLPEQKAIEKNLLIVMQEYVDSLKQMGKLDKMTIKSYQNFLNILNTYLNGKPLYESNLTLKFHADFFNYLSKQGLKNNTLWKIQKVLRTIFRYLKSQDVKIGYDYLSPQIRVSYKTPDTIALTFSELKMIHDHNSKKAPLNRVKHLFLFQCCTGVRYSDINKFVKMSDCVLQSGEKYKCFKIETEKTGAEVTIPVVSLANQIYNLYDGKLPELSNQKYNQYLKEFLNEIDYFNEVRKKYVFENKQKTLVEYTIGEQVSTHTARRTFATIMFNLGCPVRSIMKITGHIQLETFFSYIKLNADDNEQMITIKNKFEENWNLKS